MAIADSEGFDYMPMLSGSSSVMASVFGAAGFYGWWSIPGQVSIPTIQATEPQWGYGRYMRMGLEPIKRFLVGGSRNEAWFTMGVRTRPGSGLDRGGIFSLWDAATNTRVAHVAFSDFGTVKLYNTAGELIGRSEAAVFPEHQWFTAEVHVKMGPAGGGILEVRINTETVISMVDIVLGLEPVIGKPSVLHPMFSAVGWGPETSTSAAALDIDNWVMDDAGYTGVVRVQWLPPAAPGDQTQWDKFNGATNWQAASNNLLDDTSFVFNMAENPGRYDLYKVLALVNTPEILGVTVKGAYRQNDATQNFVQNVIKSGGVVTQGALRPSGSSYQFIKDVYPVDPATGLPWTYAAVNALQIGPKQGD